ncbi:hypothetical protein P43SY_003594 [Pythium insidiosum]|uniref:AAA+ ATPase domain-containing protein n=1 Tax=Pythium insidiosum TaxID=114742 RepID=A0AAD5Q9L4_PYTIN|nr:hypothetical protein P43SY_003594 [Pythium insidiosum]
MANGATMTALHWRRVHVLSGDTRVSQLRPHQLLLSGSDAQRWGLAPLSLVQFRARPSDPDAALLQVVIDRNATVDAGVVQAPSWVLHVLGLHEGDDAVLAAIEQDDREWTGATVVTLDVAARHPLRAVTATPSMALPGAATSLLPESVRSGRVCLSAALERQWRATYGRCAALRAWLATSTSTSPTPALMAFQLLGETYLFRATDVATEDACEPPSTRRWRIRTTADDELRTRDVDVLTARLDDSLSLRSGSAERQWRRGLAGYAPMVEDVLFHVLLNFTPSSASLRCAGVVLHGVSGVGKSLALRVLEQELADRKVAAWRVDAMALVMAYESARQATPHAFLVEQLSQRLPEHASTLGVVLIDDVDVLFHDPTGDASADDAAALAPLGSALLRVLDAMADDEAAARRLCIVGTVTTDSSKEASDGATVAGLPLVATRAGRFDKAIEMAVPTEATRRAILSRHLHAMKSLLPLGDAHAHAQEQVKVCDELAARMAALTGGYVAKDLVRICRNAFVAAHSATRGRDSSAVVTWQHLVDAQRQIPPSQLRQLNVASPSTGREHELAFAGYAALRQQLHDFIEWKFHPTAAMKQLGVANASGLLLHGPSGCGKSLLVQHLAARARVNVVCVKSSELLSKYFGDSERAVRQLFARARAASPCLLFFDEFDAIAHKRSFGGDGQDDGNGGGVYARLLSTFLNEMDGVGLSSRAQRGEILVIAATNRLHALDAALLRPGRIDKAIEIGLPTLQDRVEILEHCTRRMPIAHDASLDQLAARSTGSSAFTGADLAAVCRDAAFRALREDMDASSIQRKHLEAAWDNRVAMNAATSE